MKPKIVHVQISVVGQCYCPAASVLVASPGAPAKCPVCGQTWKVGKLRYELAPDGALVFECELAPDELILSPGIRI